MDLKMDVKKVHERQFEDLDASILNYYENPYEKKEDVIDEENSHDLNSIVMNDSFSIVEDCSLELSSDGNYVDDTFRLASDEEMNNVLEKNNDEIKSKAVDIFGAVCFGLFLLGIFGLLFGSVYFDIIQENQKIESEAQKIEMVKKDEYDLSLKLDLNKGLTLDDKRIIKNLDYVLNDTLINLSQEWKKNPLSKFTASFNVPSYLDNGAKKVELAIESVNTCKVIGERYFSSPKNINQVYNLEVNDKKMDNSKMLDTSCEIKSNSMPYNKIVYKWKGKG